MTMDLGAVLAQVGTAISDPTTATAGGTAAAVSAWLTNLFKAMWGGRDGNPPEWGVHLCAGVAGIAGVVLLFLAGGKDMSHGPVIAEAVAGGLLAGGGGATMLAASFKSARPNTVNIAKMEEQLGPCCALPECRYNRIPAPLGGEWWMTPPGSSSPSASQSYSGGAPGVTGALDPSGIRTATGKSTLG